MSARPGPHDATAPAATPPWRRRLCAALLAGFAIQSLAGHSMAATPASTPAPALKHCTGRFDYALPAAFRFTGGQQSLYLVHVDAEPVPPGATADAALKRRLAAAMGRNAGIAPMREFDLAGVGPAAWMTLAPARPDLVTLLAMKPLPASGSALFLQVEGSAGREAVAERVSGKVAATWTAGSPQGFCTGPGAFVVAPSINERALASFEGAGIELSIQTETVSEPENDRDGTDLSAPGVHVLSNRRRSVAGFDGVEDRLQLADEHGGQQRIYAWVFAGRAADGAAPRIRLTASADIGRTPALDAAWETLLGTLRPRPVGVR
jgi:hypothetical protein